MRAIIGQARESIYPKFAVKLGLEYFAEAPLYKTVNLEKKRYGTARGSERVQASTLQGAL